MKKFFSKNRILILATFALALLAVILLLLSRDKSPQSTDRNFAINDTSSITKIFLAKKDSNDVLLTRNSNGQWMLNKDKKASKAAVNLLLETLKKLDIKRPVSKAEHDNVIKRLSSIGVKVEVYQNKPLFQLFGIDFFTKERNTTTFYVGGSTKNNLGTYMYRDGAEIPFVVYIPGFRGYLTPRFKAKPDEWRDHTMMSYTINEIKSVEIRHLKTPQNSFRLEHPSKKQFSIIRLQNKQPVKPFDTLKVLDFLSSFHEINFENLINNFKKKDSILNSTPFHIIRVTNQSGETREIKTYRRYAPEGKKDVYGEDVFYDPDRLYASFNKGKDFALIQYYTFDNLTKKADFFKLRTSKPTN